MSAATFLSSLTGFSRQDGKSRRRRAIPRAKLFVAGLVAAVVVNGLTAAAGAPGSDGSPGGPVRHSSSGVVSSSGAVPPPVTRALGTRTAYNPPQSIPPNPNFLSDCSGTHYDDSVGCVDAVLQAIANARAQEGVLPMTLPSDWGTLTPAEQLYVATNLERTARGLAPLSGMATALDQAAYAGAAMSQDPQPPAGFPWTMWGSNWAAVLGNPLEAIYFWMYDDGLGSPNIDCTASNTSGCWGHRDNVLISLSCQPCLMGTGLDPTGYQGYPSWAELLVDTSGSPQLDFSWSQVSAFLNVPWSPDDGQPNLLSDPGFERGLAPWATAPGQNRAIYSSPSSGSGQDYLETNSGSSSSPSLYQDAQTSVAAGHSYDASVLLRSPSGNPVSAALVVWATGGSATELGQTMFTVSSTSWTRYYTDVDVANAGHSDLRLQLYLGTSGQNLDVDGAMLQDAALGDAGFSQGLGTWKNATGQNRAIYSSSSSPDGRYYLETNSGSSSAPSLYQDVSNIPVDPGHTYVASVLLRSPSGNPVSVNLDVWGLGGSSADLGQTQITVSSTTWTRYYTDVDVANSGHSDLRLQLYLNTSGQNLDVDGAMLEDGGVTDGCFDRSGLWPWQVSAGANAALRNGAGSGCGSQWLETNTNGGASSSLYQDIATAPVAGHPYTASVLLRSTTGGTISGSLVLWALGGSAPTEIGQTQITVGSSWAQYSTVLDVAYAGHTDLRFQLYLGTPGQTLAVDAATLPDVSIDL